MVLETKFFSVSIKQKKEKGLDDLCSPLFLYPKAPTEKDRIQHLNSRLVSCVRILFFFRLHDIDSIGNRDYTHGFSLTFSNTFRRSMDKTISFFDVSASKPS